MPPSMLPVMPPSIPRGQHDRILTLGKWEACPSLGIGTSVPVRSDPTACTTACTVCSGIHHHHHLPLRYQSRRSQQGTASQ
jgi:hypothetical protein